MRVHIENLEEVKQRLERLKKIDFEESVKRAATDIYNMGQTRTPKRTGELRQSMAVNKNSKTEYQVGYAKEYAPHVEYGHRMVRGGKQTGYIDGQYFLKAMCEDEEPKFREYVKKQLEEAK